MSWQGTADLMLWKYHVQVHDAIAVLMGQLSVLFVITFGLYRLMRLEMRRPWIILRELRGHLTVISGRLQTGNYDGALAAARACALLLDNPEERPEP